MQTSEARSGASMRDLLYVLFSNQRRIAIIVVVAMAVSALYLLVAKPVYVAEASILVKLGKDEMTAIETLPREQSNFLLQQRGQIINNEIEILRSEALIRAVAPQIQAHIDANTQQARRRSWLKRSVHQLRLRFKPVGEYFRDVFGQAGLGPFLSSEQAFLIHLAKQLEIEAVEETEVIYLNYKDDDPEIAAFTANALLDAYHRLRQQVHGNDHSEKFYEDQLNRLHDQIEKTEHRTAAFMKENNITQLDLQKELLVREISELERTRFHNARRIDENMLRSRGVALAAHDSSGVVPDTPTRAGANYAALDDAYFRLTTDLARLETQYDGSAREVTDIVEQQLRLKAEKSIGVGRMLSGDLAVEQSGYLASGSRLRKLRAELNSLNASTFTLAELEGTRKTLRNNYQLYRKKADELRISSDLDRSQISSVATISRAYPPPLPRSPKAWLVFSLALVLSLFLAFASALIAEFFNQTLRNAEDIALHLGLPTLASIPYDPTLVRAQVHRP